MVNPFVQIGGIFLTSRSGNFVIRPWLIVINFFPEEIFYIAANGDFLCYNIITMTGKLKPDLVLRTGLGLVFVYAGVMSFLSPENWIGFVPQWVGGIVSPELFLSVHAGFEIILGLALIVGILLPAASLIAFLDMFALLIFYGIDEVTFRDLGLLAAALALFLLTSPKGVERSIGERD